MQSPLGKGGGEGAQPYGKGGRAGLEGVLRNTLLNEAKTMWKYFDIYFATYNKLVLLLFEVKI